jgi:hypothetical protein
LATSTSFIQAINNDYIPVEEDDGETSAGEFISIRKAAERKETRAVLLNIVTELDNRVREVDVLFPLKLSDHT